MCVCTWRASIIYSMAVADIAAITVKEELADDGANQPDPLDLEGRIVELCTDHEKGVTEDMITADQPTMTKDKIMTALQRLLSMVRVLCIAIHVPTIERACFVGVVYTRGWNISGCKLQVLLNYFSCVVLFVSFF